MNTAVKLKAGEVTRIRVNPSDCLSVLDILDRAGIDYKRQGMSFAQCVSLALSSLIQSARNSSLIPEPDTFQFLNRMERFRGHSGQGRKLNLTAAIGELGANFQAPVVQPEFSLSDMGNFEYRGTMPAERALPQANEAAAQRPLREPTQAERDRLTELCKKQDLADMGKGSWTQRDQEEHDSLVKVIYPNG